MSNASTFSGATNVLVRPYPSRKATRSSIRYGDAYDVEDLSSQFDGSATYRLEHDSDPEYKTWRPKARRISTRRLRAMVFEGSYYSPTPDYSWWIGFMFAIAVGATSALVATLMLTF